ncbi:GatB/YqeY domain-containing protein [Phycicoccus sp. Soil803]|uniref:GatB/YqeY domain-containing protein n=1 Tax=Phycicoccus sp. Soil803 TaxID=1736415 RepID=UPI00070BB441|nr:GatB/YqeY domain-containing protein [Phycicoccus sp. Soil803]KRF26361.1 glutamyl-tRNA amidotransferase [Phycicoccus sp. Soil803]
MTEQSLKATVQSDLTDAIRQRDAVRSGTLRLALTSITNEEVSGTEARELSDDEVLKVLAKEAKKRKEAATAYAGAGRPELAAKEEAELAVLEAYLPAQLSDDELTSIVAAAIAQTGATGMPQLGQVMKVAQGVVAGRADGGRVAAAVKAALTKG